MRIRTQQSYKEHSDEDSRDERDDEKPAKKAAPAYEKEPKKAMKFLGPLEWTRAETGGADRWVL